MIIIIISSVCSSNQPKYHYHPRAVHTNSPARCAAGELNYLLIIIITIIIIIIYY